MRIRIRAWLYRLPINSIHARLWEGTSFTRGVRVAKLTRLQPLRCAVAFIKSFLPRADQGQVAPNDPPAPTSRYTNLCIDPASGFPEDHIDSFFRRLAVKAVSYEGVRKMSVSDQPKPKLKSPTDALLRVTTSGICGSDLHMHGGRTLLEEGTVVGHEIMGVIEEVGEAVSSIKKGDRVVLPLNIACGFCYHCHGGNTHSCLTMNPEDSSAAFGYAAMGPYAGGQAEFVLVPYANFNCLKLPGTPTSAAKAAFICDSYGTTGSRALPKTPYRSSFSAGDNGMVLIRILSGVCEHEYTDCDGFHFVGERYGNCGEFAVQRKGEQYGG